MSPPLLVLAGFLLLGITLLSAAVSALETALMALKEHHLASLKEKRAPLPAKLREIARHPRRSLHQVLILGATLNLSLAVMGLMLLRESGMAIAGSPLLAGMALLGVLVLASELIPTLVALAGPARVFRAAGEPFLRVSPCLEKVSGVLGSITDRLADAIVPAAGGKPAPLTDEEIGALVEMRHEQGVLARSESEIIQGILRLGNKTAKDCMTPRVDTLMLPGDMEEEEVKDRLRGASRWHWQVPVYQGSPDVVTGVLDVKRWLYQGHASEGGYRSAISPPVFLPETMNALEAFRDYLAQPRSLCVVLDEYGGVEGVLAHSDLIEEILSEAAPALGQEEDFEILGPGRLRADGDARLEDIGEALDLPLEHEGIATIGGLLLNELGRVAAAGDQVEVDGLRVTARRCQRQRVLSVEVERLPEPEKGGARQDGEARDSTSARQE